MSKPRVVVFFGGQAGNHDLSVETGRWVCSYIPRSQYDVTPVEITPEGTWKVPLGSLPRSGPVDVTLKRLSQAVPALPASEALNRLLEKPVDSLLTVVRGPGGDDGSLHGLARLLGSGVVGSPYSTCHQTSDKYLFSQAIDSVVRTPRSRKFSRQVPIDSIMEDVQADFLPPLFVKGAAQEGSFGTEKIEAADELRPAIARILRMDDLVVQENIPGQEYAVSLTQDERGHIQVLPLTTITPHHAPFYDQLAKRRAGRVALHTSDAVSPLAQEIQDIAREVYEELHCAGTITLDVISDGDDIAVLEANTIPTLSAYTPLHQQLQAAGLHPSRLFASLVRSSLEASR